MKNSKLSTKSVSAGLIAAIVASLCCITPVLSMVAGIGGIAASFSWMEPIRPYLIAFTIIVIGFAWYQKLKSKRSEELDCDCAEYDKSSFWQSKRFLGIISVFAVLMLGFPSYSHIFYSNISITESTPLIEKTIYEFEIEGMTCTGCEEYVKHEVLNLPGIKELEVSHEAGNAIITFDVTQTSTDSILTAIKKTGYQVKSKTKL